jgi:hypothetical protein
MHTNNKNIQHQTIKNNYISLFRNHPDNHKKGLPTREGPTTKNVTIA